MLVVMIYIQVSHVFLNSGMAKVQVSAYPRYKDDGTIDQFFSKLAIEDSKTSERLYSCLVQKPSPDFEDLLGLWHRNILYVPKS